MANSLGLTRQEARSMWFEVLVFGIGYLFFYGLSVIGAFGVVWWFLGERHTPDLFTLLILGAWLLVLCGIAYLSMVVLTYKAQRRSCPDMDRGVRHGLTMLISCVAAALVGGMLFAWCDAKLTAVLSGML